MQFRINEKKVLNYWNVHKCHFENYIKLSECKPMEHIKSRDCLAHQKTS